MWEIPNVASFFLRSLANPAAAVNTLGDGSRSWPSHITVLKAVIMKMAVGAAAK